MLNVAARTSGSSTNAIGSPSTSAMRAAPAARMTSASGAEAVSHSASPALRSRDASSRVEPACYDPPRHGFARREWIYGRSAVLDGEICCLEPDGRTDFRKLLFRREWPYFYAFDVVSIEGEDLPGCRCSNGSAGCWRSCRRWSAGCCTSIIA